MKNLYRVIVMLLILCLTLTCVGCSSGEYGSVKETVIYSEDKILTADSALVAQNTKYELHWDNIQKNVLLKDKSSGAVWSTSPVDENGEVLADESSLYSPINLEYIMRSGFRTLSVTGKAGAVEKDGVSSELIDNGLRITYLFKDLQISIPLEFVLTDRGLEISADLEKIAQNADVTGFRSFKISLAPYMCSVVNTAENYLFVPSGSGALMYADERGSGAARSFSGKVYGEDITEEKNEEFTYTESVKFPVFGGQNGNNTISCIVNDGEELCSIKANVGDGVTGISNAYAEFQVYGYNGTVMDYGGSTGKKLVNYYSYDRISTGKISVLYTPVTTEKSGIVNIADEYRNYLSDSGLLNERAEENKLSLVLYGGMELKKHLFGIPYNKVTALTSFSDVLSVLKELEATDMQLDVKLVGFGVNGINGGKLAGGFTYSSKLGSKKELKELQDYCSDKNIDLYFDYDTVNFSKSGNGFSTNSDNASAANGYPAQRYSFSAVTGAGNESTVSSLLSRGKLETVIDKVIASAEKMGFSAVSLSTFSNTVYSDYSSLEYACCGNTVKDYTKAIKSIKNENLKLSGSSANSFVAARADKLFDAPTYSGKLSDFDCDVPFYQIVFKGYVPFSTESVNIAENSQKQLLKALEVGGGLQFSLIKNYTSEYASYNNEDLNLMIYKNNATLIKETVEKTEDLYEKLNGARVIDYQIINASVRKTVFDNGAVIYVNYGTEKYISDEITVDGLDFRMVI